MSDLVGNPEDRYYRNVAHINKAVISLCSRPVPLLFIYAKSKFSHNCLLQVHILKCLVYIWPAMTLQRPYNA